jgi:adenine-specific DNA-methyltransferase
MAKIEITKTELVWPGKYDEEGALKVVPPISLPFQVIETINETRATREAKKSGVQQTLFDVWEGKEGDTFDAGWRNKLIWGENLLVMGSLLQNFAGKIDLIYIDPPFATGADFSFTTQIGDGAVELAKEQSLMEEKAYRDTWASGIGSFVSMLHDRFRLIRELLAPHGSLYVHIDENMLHYVKVVLDEIFADTFRNDIIVRSTFAHADAHQFGSVHQNVLFYTKNNVDYSFEPIYVPYEDDYVQKYYRYKDTDGRRWLSCSLTGAGASGGQFTWRDVLPPPGRHWAFTAGRLDELDREGRIFWTKNGIPRLKQYLDEMKGMPASDVWWDKDCQPLLTWTSESVGYPTQKPEALLSRIIQASSKPGHLVADFFCGSGAAAPDFWTAG